MEYKRKRSQRNKERLVAHQSKLLDSFASGVTRGYSNENWETIAKTYKQISGFLTAEEYTELGTLWRNSYTSYVNPKRIRTVVESIKERLLSHTKL